MGTNEGNNVGLKPNFGTTTSDFTVNGNKIFQFSLTAGVGKNTVDAVLHNYSTTSGIQNWSVPQADGSFFNNYSVYNVTEAGYYKGKVETTSININAHGQYKLAELNNGGELLVNGGVNVRNHLNTSGTLNAEKPFGDATFQNERWGSRTTMADGSEVYQKYKTENTMQYNTGFLQSKDGVNAKIQNTSLNYYGTLNYAQQLNNGTSFNVGAGIAGFGSEFRPLVTANLKHELESGIKIGGGINYTFTGGNKIDHEAFNKGAANNAFKHHTNFDTYMKWDHYDTTVKPYEPKSFGDKGTQLPTHGMVQTLNNPARAEAISDLSGAFNKASMGQLGAHLSISSPEMKLGKNASLEVFGRVDVNFSDALTRLNQDKHMGKNANMGLNISEENSIQRNINTESLKPTSNSATIGFRVNFGGDNPDKGTKCPIR
jgi:hypothetical protein